MGYMNTLSRMDGNSRIASRRDHHHGVVVYENKFPERGFYAAYTINSLAQVAYNASETFSSRSLLYVGTTAENPPLKSTGSMPPLEQRIIAAVATSLGSLILISNVTFLKHRDHASTRLPDTFSISYSEVERNLMRPSRTTHEGQQNRTAKRL